MVSRADINSSIDATCILEDRGQLDKLFGAIFLLLWLKNIHRAITTEY